MEIRSEKPQDFAGVRELNQLAFDNGPEADLVDLLRSECKEYMAFVSVLNLPDPQTYDFSASFVTLIKTVKYG